MNWRLIAVLLLGVVDMLSAFGVVVSTHQARMQYQRLTALEKTRDELEVEWGRLQLEQASLARLAKIEERATSELHMVMPRVGDTVMVEP